MALTSSIMIVGSLYWDKQDHRKAWRNERLHMDKAVEVMAPIRYGRKSQSRGGTYTMVFSHGGQLGKAKLVPCLGRISTLNDLIAEAECLWAAEQPANSEKRNLLSAIWGCVGLLPRAASGKAGDDGLREILDGWSKRVANESNYDGKRFNAPDGRCLVDKHGLLQIPWPDCADGSGPAPFDIVLATVTKPTPDPVNTHDYPSAKTVARAWKNDKADHMSYFLRNRECGIWTFQDEEIEAHISGADAA